MLPVIAVVFVILLAYYVSKREIWDLRSKYVQQHETILKVQNEINRQLNVIVMCKDEPDKCKNPSAVVAQSATLVPELAAQNGQVLILIKEHSEDIATLEKLSGTGNRSFERITAKYPVYAAGIMELSKAVDSQIPRITELVK